MARHSLSHGHRVRHALSQPVARHAVDVALAAAGHIPVRRGVATVAVIGSALSAAGASFGAPAPHGDAAHAGPVTIGLAAASSNADNTGRAVDKHDDLAGASNPVLDYQALADAVVRATQEGHRLAGDDQKARERFDAALASAAASAAATLGQGSIPTGNGRTASLPGQLIDTHDWYLTLPTGKENSPDTINGSKLADYHSKFFQLNQSHDGIMFTANAGGATTSGSHYPRSELREMDGAQKADWDADSGTHTLDLIEAITETPKVKPTVISAQIHDDKDDVMQIHLDGKQLTAMYADGKKNVVLDDDYQLGTKFAVRIEATKGHIRVWYNGVQKADLPITATKSYFKAGSYVNSNPDHGESGSAQGQVVVYSAKVSHTS